MTNLAKIDEVVNQFVEGDALELPEAMIQKKCTDHIAGFQIISSQRLNNLKEQSNNSRNMYVAQRTALKEALAKRDVTAKAFLPVKVWNEVCQRSDLFQLDPDAANQIRVRVNADAITRIWSTWTMFALCVLAGTAVDSWIVPGLDSNSLPMRLLAYGGFGLTAAVAMLICCAIIMGTLFEKQFDRMFLWLHCKTSSRFRLLMHFMPYKNTVRCDTGIRGDNIAYVTLRLPDPPAAVMATLNKLHNFQQPLRVAAVAEAIHFTSSDYSILKTDQDERFEQRRIEWANRDPIIYVQFDTCVAIIEQFGDFPIEIETVRNCLKLEFLL